VSSADPAPALVRRARVVSVSDRSSRGSRPDTSGPLLAQLLRGIGLDVGEVVLVPDEVEAVQEALRAAAGEAYDLVVTTGGTGLAPRDVTPEATAPLLDRTVPGLAELLRARGAATVPTAVLSRGLVGTIGSTLVVNLPGSTGGVRDGVAVLAPVLEHALAQLRGGGDHGPPGG
jgi:molybdenum cofactor biosynthesis protein B